MWPSHTGWEKRFRGKLEFKDEEDQKRVAIVRDGASVLEIPWSSKYYPEKAHLEAGRLYEVTVRDDEPVDLDASMVFVSDRVHNSHGDRVIDSEWFTLVRIKDAAKVVYDEAVCEVHHIRMQRVRAEVGYGMYGAATEADAVCDKEYPHHADWIRGGCLVGDVKTAHHYVCADCVAATAKYKREHVNDEKQLPSVTGVQNSVVYQFEKRGRFSVFLSHKISHSVHRFNKPLMAAFCVYVAVPHTRHASNQIIEIRPIIFGNTFRTLAEK